MHSFPEKPDDPARRDFDSTHWSLVLRAGDGSDDSQAALEQLFQTYWYPIYAFVRRNGFHHHDALDVTQGYFTQLLENGGLTNVHPDKGRFRSFLLASVRNFIRNEWRHRRAQKRGGDLAFFSISQQEGEGRFQQELSDNSTPEEQFERDWVASLLQQVVARLRKDYEIAGRLKIFEALHAWLVADVDRIPLRAIADELQMTVSAVKMSAHRMKKRYAELLRAEVANTVANESEIDDELNRLIQNVG